MIQAERLSLTFGEEPLFEDINFCMQRGERCGLIGRNGCGKSTLFRLILGHEKADSGKVMFPKGYKIGYLQQHIHFTQKTAVNEAALGLPEDDRDAIYKVESLLMGLGFSLEQLDSDPSSFSGGYQLRIQLAKVLLSQPDCLLLDEPTNYLDITSIRFLTKFLQQWEREMILISHDLQFLDAVTNSMMTIHRKSAFKIKGKSEDLFTLIAEEEERHESMRKNLEKKRAHLESFIDRFGAKASKASQANARKKALDKMPALEKLKDLYQLSFSFNQSPFMGKKMLEASSLSFSYDPSQPLISNFSLTIEKGDRIAIIGKNGAGKSTLMKLLAKENQPDSGCVSLSSSACLGYFGQTNIDRLDKTLTIEEEISRANSLLTMTEVRGICGLMMFGKDLAKKKISVLSGGERSRVLIGKIIAEPCNMLFLDEPTHHLDIESIEALIDAIEEFNGSCVIVTHSEWVLRRLPLNKLIICSESGQEVFNGSYDEFLEKQGWDEPKPKKKKEPSAIKTAPAQSISHEKQIKQFEKRLQDLEKDLENNNLLLSTLTPSEGKKKIELLLRIEKIQTEINNIYQSIENLY